MRLKHILTIAAFVSLAIGCEKKSGIDGDLSFLSTAKTSNPASILDITNDNSGNVTITPTAEGASSFVVLYGDPASKDSVTLKPGNSTTHAYKEGSYTVTIVSTSLSGAKTVNTYPLQVTYRPPENINITTSSTVHDISVQADALYAASFLVYFGDVANETGTPLAKGAIVKHTYANAGDYTVKVVALSGGAAQSDKETTVTIYNPFGLPITFDDSHVNDFFGTFGTNQQFEIGAANPNPSGINTSAKVGKFVRGKEGWSGTYSPLDNPIDMSVGKKIKVFVYNPDPAMVGKLLNVELENGSSIANGIAVLKAPVTKSGMWEELTFDYSTIAAIPDKETFKQLVLRFNDAYEGTGTGGQGTVIYLDNFRLTN